MSTSRRPDIPLDTHLLRIFATVITERSVSRAAHIMDMSQPAVSASLGKLRLLFGDPLLVRGKSGMVPTERAIVLLEHARIALEQIEKMAASSTQFEPGTSQHTFKIGAPDYLAPSFMAHVIQRVRKEAPSIQLQVQSLGPTFDLEKSLADAELDLVIGNWPEPPPGMYITKLYEEDIVCLMNANHPFATRTFTRDDYVNTPHIVPLRYSLGHRGVIDRTLAELKLSRRQMVTVQSFLLAPYLLIDTDLVFTTTRQFAAHYCNLLNLVYKEPPVDFPKMRFYQLWHERLHPSPAHKWLRSLLVHASHSFESSSE